MQVPRLPQPKLSVLHDTARVDRTGLDCGVASHRQLKTFSVREDKCLQNPNAQGPKVIKGDQGPKKETGTSNCHGVGSAVDAANATAACTEGNDSNVSETHEAGCDISTVSADSCKPDTEANSVETAQAAVARKKKKTVTFSDNVELVASATDVVSTVDYMSYAASIGRHANSTTAASKPDPLPDGVSPASNCCWGSELVNCSDNSDAVDTENSVTSSGCVKCSLCRQKWVKLTDTYCSDCRFYLSRLQMS